MRGENGPSLLLESGWPEVAAAAAAGDDPDDNVAAAAARCCSAPTEAHRP